MRALLRVVALLSLVTAAAGCMPANWGADALLHPPKRQVNGKPEGKVEDVTYDVGIKLVGWRFPAEGAKRGTIIYLHGLGDNRGSGAPIARHFVPKGYDVISYDGRAHGDSGGDVCSYGYFEKQDLRRVIDQLGGGPVIVFGISLGAGVAVQAAADDPRIAVVVAVAPIADLRVAALERSPFFASRGNVEDALRIAEETGKFRMDDVNPAASAARVHAPTLIVHGANDEETPPEHAQKVFAALPGPTKKLVLVPRAGHGNVLTPDSWKQIDDWVDSNAPKPTP